MDSLEARCLKVAAMSPCNNRKVGCLLVDMNDNILAEGYNHSSVGLACEDANGATEAHVIHAEMHALTVFEKRYRNLSATPLIKTVYVTHNPCPNCLAELKRALGHSFEIIVVASFMKFDSDKLRYDLIPAAWHEGDAEVLTGGAKKYKPNNWKEVDDIGRYIAAMERHFTPIKEFMETGNRELLYDKDTGLHHMKHLRTNAGFLLTLTEKENEE